MITIIVFINIIRDDNHDGDDDDDDRDLKVARLDFFRAIPPKFEP